MTLSYLTKWLPCSVTRPWMDNRMSKQIIIVSGGRFSREVYSWIMDCIEAGSSWRVKGFLDDRVDVLKDFPCQVGILDTVEHYAPQPDDCFVCAIGEPMVRKKYVEVLKSKGARFAQVIHPTVVIGKNVAFGEGVILAPYSVFSASLDLGDFVNVGCGTVCSHHNRIGDWCQLSGNCSLPGGVVLGEGVFVACGVIFIPEIQVGAWSYIGAGSVVIKDVPERTKVFGNPARSIGSVDETP